MDITQIIVGVIALVGSLGGSVIGMIMNQRLSTYKIEQLEKKVESVPELEKVTQNLQSELEKEVQNLQNEIEKQSQNLQSELEKQIQNLHSELEKETQAIHSELDSFVSTSQERRKMVEDIQEDVEQLKIAVNGINTKIALIENEIKLFKQQLG